MNKARNSFFYVVLYSVVFSLFSLSLVSLFVFRFEEFFSLNGPNFLDIGPITLSLETIERMLFFFSILLGVTLFAALVMSFWLKRLPILSIISVGFCLAISFSAYQGWQEEKIAQEAASEIIQLLPSGDSSRLSLSSLREFIHQNANFQDATAFYNSSAFNMPLVLSALLKHAQGTGAPPDLLCGPAALAMQRILIEKNIDARIVFLWSRTGLVDGSHVIVEAKNPVNNQWEAHDPMYNLMFFDLNGKAMSIVHLVMMDSLENVIPCNEKGCGWDQVKASAYLENDYFSAVEYPQSHSFLINPLRLDLSKTFENFDNLKFEEYFDKARANPVFIKMPRLQ